jgi:SOS response associated peptidase (SRAP)
VVTTLQHRADPASPGDPPASEGISPTAFSDEVGSYSPLGKRPFYRFQHDQREVRDRRVEACIPRSSEISQVLDPNRRFYEWARTANGKQPFCFEVSEVELFAFAGLWDGWKDPSGNWVKTCSVLTTIPNAVTSAVHDRMPVILDPDSYDLWLDPGMQDVVAISEVLKPYDARLMRCYPVSTRVNSVSNDDLECSRPVELVEAQDRLFS